MSAQPAAPNTAPDLVNVEIDGKKVQVAKGSMIIQASDAAGIGVPRFCYHKKLPIAANCRMCLVEVEKMPKPAPACATPVMEGMVVRTQSAKALASQRNVMEFLLINHPLDCPICDQGGECELQDVAMGYGRSVSRFAERKRSVADENLGPLVATDMTRCIHCTRCVRFMDEIAGTQELGGMYRGEHLEIGTFTGKPLASELSGNVIDVCPVGALTNKVFRYRARAWELIARESIAYHDALHSNLWLHIRRGEVLRTVPRDNEAINECWLSDRDRYSHQALTHADRLLTPRIKRDGQWQDVSWSDALAVVAKALTAASGDVGAVLSPMASCEDGWLAGALLRGLGSSRIEHRLRTLDIAGSNPGLAAPLAGYDQVQSVLLIGSNPRLDQPLLGHRLRQASKRGAAISAINPVDFDFHFPLRHKLIAAPAALLQHLGGVAAAVAALAGVTAPTTDSATDAHQQIARSLRDADSARILLGDVAIRHPQASALRTLAQFIAAHSGALLDEMGDGSNAVGLARVGARSDAGLKSVLGSGTLLLQGVEAADVADSIAFSAAIAKAGTVIALSAFADAGLLEAADVLLPLALPPESEGSYVNIEGRVQTVAAGAKAPGDARAAWRIYKALADQLTIAGFEFTDFAGAFSAAAEAVNTPALAQDAAAAVPVDQSIGGLNVIALVPAYGTDAVVRRSAALADSPLGAQPGVEMHPEDALALGLGADSQVANEHGSWPLRISARVPNGCCVVFGGAAPLTGSQVTWTKVSHV